MHRKTNGGSPVPPNAPASGFLASVARRLSSHWKRSLAAAVGVLVLLVLAAGAGGKGSDDYSIPGTESQQAVDLFKAHSPAFGGADSTLVFTVDKGKVSDPAPRAAIEGALAKVRELDGVKLAASPFESGGQVSENGRLAAVDVRYSTDPSKIEKKDGEALIKAGETAEPAVQVEARGYLVDMASEQSAPVGELIGVLIAIVLLTLLFRSGAAMAATLIGALTGVIAGQILLAALAAPLGLPSFAAVIAVMLGLGAGIDYSLLIMARYREQRAAGDNVPDAAARAAATSGAAVVAAGVIVMVAIAGLLVVGVPYIGKMGLGAAIAIAVVVVAALTVLPIMMGAFGRKLVPKKPEHVQASPAFTRWGEIVTRRPWASIAAGVVLLLVIAFPVTGMRLGQPDDGNQAKSHTQRVAYDQLTEAFGPGSNGPFLLAVDTPKGAPETAQQLNALQQAVADTPGVATAAPPSISADGEMATIFAIPATAPQDARTSNLLDTLRQDVIPKATAGTPLKVYVGGSLAVLEDTTDRVASRLPLFIFVVIGLSVLLLVMAFRSLWIPLVSALFNLLSVAAAYGVVVAVFQEGIGASLIGADSGVPIISFLPVMLFAILFGLSMDYNVFLLSRIHEAYDEGDRPRASVIHGMGRIDVDIPAACLLCADDLEALVDEDVVRPVDADDVDVVLAVAQQHDTVDGASWVGGHRSGLGLVRCCSGDDLARPGGEARRDLTDLRGRARLTLLERDDLPGRSRGRRRRAAARTRVGDRDAADRDRDCRGAGSDVSGELAPARNPVLEGHGGPSLAFVERWLIHCATRASTLPVMTLGTSCEDPERLCADCCSREVATRRGSCGHLVAALDGGAAPVGCEGRAGDVAGVW
jgi:RND superfamily putative drug exporter